MKPLPRNSLIVWIIAAAILAGCSSMYLSSSPAGGGGGDGGGAGGDDFLTSGQTSSFFSAIQIDPRSEDSAGPQFADAGDLDGDGFLDLVSGWNQSQPVQIHLQRRDANGSITFLTVPLGGTTPIARVAGLKIADIDVDGNPDVVVLVKDTGTVAVCDPERPDCDPNDNGGVVANATMGEIIIFFAPDDPVTGVWEPVELVQSMLAGAEADSDRPEDGGYSALAVGDVDGVDGLDIVVALNSAEGDPKQNSIDLYANPGAGGTRDQGAWVRTMLWWNIPTVKDCKLLDVDRDGDVDVVCTYPDAKSANVQWLVNPLDGGDPGDILREWGVPAPIGQVHTQADTIALGDVDRDGITDVVVRSSIGMLVQWFKGPSFPSFDYIRNPWQVYTMAEFIDRAPGAVALGDLNGNGVLDAAVGAEGALAWFDSSQAYSVFDQWAENMIIDDSPPSDADDEDQSDLQQLVGLLTDEEAGPEAATGTMINTVLIVDLDGDGDMDIIATLDRSGMSGLTNDALIWFRNNSAG